MFIRKLCFFILLSFVVCIAYAQANHSTIRVDPFNTLPDSNTPTFRTDSRNFWDHENAQLYGRALASFVFSGGIHTAAGGCTNNVCTSQTFSTEAFVPERVNQVSTAIAYSAVQTGDTCWTIISSDNDGITGWTRVGTTAYYYQCEGDTTPSEPTLPANSVWLMGPIAISGNAIASVTDKRQGSAVVPAYAFANLPTVGFPGRIVRVTDNFRGLWQDTGFSWIPLNRRVISLDDFFPIGDGTLHLLSERYATLGAAQFLYPHATSLTDSIDWAALQGAVNAAGGVGIVGITGNGRDYVLNRTLTLPQRSVTGGGNGSTGITLRGMSNGAGRPIIRLTVASTLVDGSSTTVALRDEYRFFENITFSGFNPAGTQIATIGLNIQRNSHFWIENCWFEGFTVRAVQIGESVSYNIIGNKFIDIDGKGIDATVSGVSDFNNGGNITGNTFANVDGWALDFIQGQGIHIAGNTFDGAKSGAGAIRIQNRFNGVIIGNHFENNTSRDIDLGLEAPGPDGGVIAGNFFGGGYAAILLRRARGISITENFLNGGTQFLEFTLAGSFQSVHIERNSFNSTIATTVPITDLYANLPVSFADTNTLIHEESGRQLLVGGNALVGDFPYGGWNLFGGAGTTFAKSGERFQGRRGTGLLTKTTNSAAITNTINIDTDSDGQLRRRFVTFEVWVENVSGSSISLTLSFGSATRSTTADPNTAWSAVRLTTFVLSADTALDLNITLNTNNSSIYLSSPRVYVGAGGTPLPIMLDRPYWANASAPTTGTWHLADFVWNTNPTGSTPTIGWVCTSSGSPGTWVAQIAN